MNYYRKAAALFILVLTLILPLFLEQSQETAVVDLEILLEKSQYLSELSNGLSAQNSIEDSKNIKEREAEIMQLVKKTAFELGEKNNYSSILIKQPIYKGGKDITFEVAEQIDKNN